tara:strand:+ start:104 stop:298 length:195 start_codon:yes stop_codon:yes gene_type:complete
MRFGCFECCFPRFISLRLALVVEAYSEAVMDLIAFSGKYLSPVLELGLPDFVLHFCFVQFLRLL